MDGATLFAVWQRRAADRPPGMAVLGLLTFMTAWNDFFWPIIALPEREPHRAGRAQPAGAAATSRTTAVIMAGTLVATCRCSSVFVCSAGRSSAASCKAPSRDDPDNRRQRRPPVAATARLPARLPLGRGHRVVPDRGRGRRGRPHPSIWDTFAQARAGRGRRHRRRRLRPLPPVREDVALMAELGLTRTGSRWPGRGSSRTGGPGQPARAGLLPTGWSTSCSSRHRALGDALPLGPAAGAGGRRRLDQPRHAGRFAEYAADRARPRWATACRPGSRSTSRGAPRSSATRAACTRRAAPTRPPRWRRAPPDARARARRAAMRGAAPRARWASR